MTSTTRSRRRSARLAKNNGKKVNLDSIDWDTMFQDAVEPITELRNDFLKLGNKELDKFIRNRLPLAQSDLIGLRKEDKIKGMMMAIKANNKAAEELRKSFEGKGNFEERERKINDEMNLTDEDENGNVNENSNSNKSSKGKGKSKRKGNGGRGQRKLPHHTNGDSEIDIDLDEKESDKNVRNKKGKGGSGKPRAKRGKSQKSELESVESSSGEEYTPGDSGDEGDIEEEEDDDLKDPSNVNVEKRKKGKKGKRKSKIRDDDVDLEDLGDGYDENMARFSAKTDRSKGGKNKSSGKSKKGKRNVYIGKRKNKGGKSNKKKDGSIGDLDSDVINKFENDLRDLKIGGRKKNKVLLNLFFLSFRFCVHFLFICFSCHRFLVFIFLF